MKKLYAGLIGLAAVSAVALQANAADMYPGPGGYKDLPYPVTWAGFYGGADVGYGSATASDQLACGAACVADGTAGSFGGVSPAGWLFGLHFGYNWQGFGYSPLVLGIETDVAAASVYGQGSDADGDFYHSRLEALGTVRGRVGYAMDRTLFYFTGGLAWGTMFNEVITSSAADFTTNPTAVGYVLGGGIEYKFWRDLSVKVEYQYVNLGKNDPVDPSAGAYSAAANGGTVRDDAFNTVRVGFNWWPFPASEPLK